MPPRKKKQQKQQTAEVVPVPLHELPRDVHTHLLVSLLSSSGNSSNNMQKKQRTQFARVCKQFRDVVRSRMTKFMLNARRDEYAFCEFMETDSAREHVRVDELRIILDDSDDYDAYTLPYDLRSPSGSVGQHIAQTLTTLHLECRYFPESFSCAPHLRNVRLDCLTSSAAHEAIRTTLPPWVHRLELGGLNVDDPSQTPINTSCLSRFTALDELGLFGVELLETPPGGSLAGLSCASLCRTLRALSLTNVRVHLPGTRAVGGHRSRRVYVTDEQRLSALFGAVSHLTGLRDLGIKFKFCDSNKSSSNNIINLMTAQTVSSLTALTALTALYVLVTPVPAYEVLVTPFLRMPHLRVVLVDTCVFNWHQRVTDFCTRSASRDVIVRATGSATWEMNETAAVRVGGGAVRSVECNDSGRVDGEPRIHSESLITRWY